MVYGVLGAFYFLFYNGGTENTEFFFSVFSVPLVVLFYNTFYLQRRHREHGVFFLCALCASCCFFILQLMDNQQLINSNLGFYHIGVMPY